VSRHAVVIALALAACGRLHFDASRVDGSSGDDGASGSDGSVDAASLCPASYTSLGMLPHRYRILGMIDYAPSVALCQADGQHAMVVDGPDEVTELLTVIVPGTSAAWSGVAGTNAGEWRTALGAVAQYLPWAPGEPTDPPAVGITVSVRGSGSLDPGKFVTEMSAHNYWAICECP
jgi:hypothetical protein